jgi:hypothetical protein
MFEVDELEKKFRLHQEIQHFIDSMKLNSLDAGTGLALARN